MQCSIDEWRQHHYEVIRTGELQLAAGLVADVLLRHPDGRERGIVLAAHALNLYLNNSIAEAGAAIRQAMPLLYGVDLLHALLTALAITEVAGDTASGQAYAHELCSLMSQNPAGPLAPWRGRVMLAIAHHYRLSGGYQAALNWARASIHWHESNTGPYDDTDRLCYLCMSLIARAESYLGLGDIPFAQADYMTARTIAPAQFPALHELAAQMALAVGDREAALQAARQLEESGSPLARAAAARVRVRIASRCEDPAQALPYDLAIPAVAASPDWQVVLQLEAHPS